MLFSKRWLVSGVILGAVVAVLGRWDWGVAAFVFCLTAAWAQDKLNRQARLQARIASIQ